VVFGVLDALVLHSLNVPQSENLWGTIYGDNPMWQSYRAFRLLALGSMSGLALGILGSQVLEAIVYQATSRDPLVLRGVVLAMALVGLLATWIPAQRALTLDPMKLLREE
jgi:hypothetical protein